MPIRTDRGVNCSNCDKYNIDYSFGFKCTYCKAYNVSGYINGYYIDKKFIYYDYFLSSVMLRDDDGNVKFITKCKNFTSMSSKEKYIFFQKIFENIMFV